VETPVEPPFSYGWSWALGAATAAATTEMSVRALLKRILINRGSFVGKKSDEKRNPRKWLKMSAI
jgi:hypothetical protein